MNKGGKFIFGESIIRADGTVRFPTQAVDEYNITSEKKVYLFTGSKITGGFCVTRKGLLLPSKLGHILTETPELLRYEAPAGAFIPYKGRSYCWTEISETGEIELTDEMMAFCSLNPGCGFCRSAAATSHSRWVQRDRCWKRPPILKTISRYFKKMRLSRRLPLDIRQKTATIYTNEH